MYPDRKTLSTQTGHNRASGSYLYRNYKSRQSLIFNIAFKDERLHLKEQVQNINGINFIGFKIGLNSASAIKDLAFQLKNEIENLVLGLGAEIDEKANLSVMISETLVKDKGWNESQIIREAAKEIQGGGGGQSFYASAGGKNPKGMEAAINKVRELIK